MVVSFCHWEREILEKKFSVFKNEKYGNEVFKCFDFRIEIVALLVFLFGVFMIYSAL